MTVDRGPAVLLLSGGLDSATVLSIAMSEGFEPHLLTFRYGQRHAAEVDAARAVAASAKIAKPVEVEISLRLFGGSALTADIDVPRRGEGDKAASEIPITYVPARNTIFLSYAVAFAEVLEAGTIFIGANAVDYSGYPDCRPEYIEAFERMANLATRRAVEGSPVRIEAPLMNLSKAEIIRRGLELGVDYGLTRSCYNLGPSGESCGECDSCALRLAGFEANGLEDPAPYAARTVR
jgi:7-cyano-7-deazaguanine synthase